MNQKQLAKHFKTNINWQRFVNLAASLGDQLNDAQWRFFKAIVFENSMESYSDGSVKYVGQEGCDLIVTVDGKEHRVEMKYTEHALYTPKGKSAREFCQSITLMNSKGTNTHKQLPKNYADFVLVVGCRAAALVDKTTLSAYCNFNGDSITTDKMPTKVMDFVFDPSSVQAPTVQAVNLREELNEAVRRTVAKITQ